jgi:hypothetical protein
MVKEFKNRRDERKKPSLTLKEKRAKKQQKRKQKYEHNIESPLEYFEM